MAMPPLSDCSHCAGTGVVRNLDTLSPADDEPCECVDREDDEPDDLEVYDRCCAEGVAAYRSGKGRDECPYDRVQPRERAAWLDGYDDGFA